MTKKHTSMNTSDLQWYPKGFFPLLLRVEDKAGNAGSALTPESILSRFVERAKGKYDLRTSEADSPQGEDTSRMSGAANEHTQRLPSTAYAETRIAVPFPDRENIRIDYNIFSSEIDDECGTPFRFHFRMESDF